LSLSARFDKDNGDLLGSLDTSTRLRTLERCFVASLVADVGQVLSNETVAPPASMYYLNEISKEFPMFSKVPSAVAAQKLIESLDSVLCAEETPVGSFRTLILHGLLLEARQLFEQAFKLYEFARERNPANTAVVMREICVLRQMKKLTQCVTLLNSYLAVYAADHEGWKELCLIYLETGELLKAKFCMEEVLLLMPQEGNFLLMYAEILYSLAMTMAAVSKRVEHLEMSRQQYVLALESLGGKHPRALFGLHLCCVKLSDADLQSHSADAAPKNVVLEMRRWTAQTLIKRSDAKQRIILSHTLK